MIFSAAIDTNVLVSALISSHDDAATVQVVGKLFSGEVIPLFSKAIFKEYNEVLRRTKFRFSEENVRLFLQGIEACGEWVVPAPTGELLPDGKDLLFYEVVVEKQKDDAYLVTGNKRHFTDKAFIVTAKEFMEILNSAE